MAAGDYSIYITAGLDSPKIEWPQALKGDDAVVAFIKDLRKWGIGTTSKMDNSTGQLRIVAGQQLGVYQKALMYEPVDFKFIVTEEELSKPIAVKPPVSVWTLQMVEAVQMTAPGPGVWLSLYSQQPAPVPSKQQEDYSDLAGELSKHIPDIRKSVKGPCRCKQYQTGQIWYLIQHLNDHHHPEKKVNGRRIKDVWTRERIADWLDEVDADLAFDPDLPAKREAKREAKRKAAEAARKAQREQLIKDGVVTAEQLKQITADLAQVAGPIKSSTVKLNVAIDEFTKSMQEIVVEIGPAPGCTCVACKAKTDLYPEKFPDQEES